MVDPVSLGPVGRANNTLVSLSNRREPSAPAPSKSDAAGASASLPRLMTLAADLARQGPPVDYARIAQVRQAIAAGQYEIDANSIAQSIVAFHRSGKA